MSATLDSKLFCTFFHNAPLISVPGRTFPISEYFLEDILESTNHVIEEGSRNAIKRHHYDTSEATLWVTGRGGEKRKEIVSLGADQQPAEVTSNEYMGYSMSVRRSMERVDEMVMNYDLIEDLLKVLLIHPERNSSILPPESSDNDACSLLSNGSILVFLPGMGKIRTLHERLRCSRLFGSAKFDIIPMHSSLSSKDQKRAFLQPRRGCQKIILATNIAETSVTIADCVCGTFVCSSNL